MNFIPAEPQLLIKEHLLDNLDALLFVGMGVGKTAGCLDTLNELFSTADAFAALVVAPMRVANLTWPMEIKDWEQFSWMRIANLRTESGQRAFLNGTAHIYVINYEALNTLVSLVERRGGTLPYDVVIFDELTRAKNPSSKRINLYRRKVPRAERQWGLTGTPIPNSWTDLFAQVRLIDGGARLGNNFQQFKNDYFINPDPNKNIFAEGQRSIEPWEEKPDIAQTLERKISDITLTLKSSDWLNLPDTVFEDVEINFTPELEKQYKRLEKDLVMQLREDKILNVTSAAALVTKLLQFTSGHIYDDEKEVHAVHNLKFEAIKHIAKREKQPLLVAYIFKHEEQRLRAQFPQAKFFCDAKTIQAQERLITDWNAGNVEMLCSHPASVGHGLNLQYGSSLLLYISLTYSRENYEQMIARLARRGQANVTRVFRLMVPGTVDDAVAEALANKAQNEARLISALQMLESYRNTK